ncbi:MAG: hypothetical protein GX558_12335 [Clostridiales bacterium]|nr:hypothetical protein [Clostridiales bacterium]
MRLLYMGSGASEGVPCPFCRCAACEAARQGGGRLVRTRSGALIDGVLKLDFPPDTPHQALTLGVSLADLRHMLITHSHEDHLDHWLLALPPSQRRHRANRDLPLHIYGNDAVCDLMEPLADRAVQPLHRLAAFSPVEIAGYRVTPLPARHKPDEQALNYLIEKGGSSLYYAHDTGMPPDEAIEHLRGANIGLVSMDATKGVIEQDYDSHMSLRENLRLRDRLLAIGAARPGAIFVANHFSHSGIRPLDEMERLADGMLLAYDGMEIEW